MQISDYTGKIIEIEIENNDKQNPEKRKNYFFHGELIDQDDKFININDVMNGSMFIKKEKIITIRIMQGARLSYFLNKLETIGTNLMNTDKEMLKKVKDDLLLKGDRGATGNTKRV